jgi:hypothetical protein
MRVSVVALAFATLPPEETAVISGESSPDDVLKRRGVGVNLAPGGLGEQLLEGCNLLVFLRHLRCILFRETIADITLCSSPKTVITMIEVPGRLCRAYRINSIPDPSGRPRSVSATSVT